MVWLFSLTLFVSSTLLFLIQPMVGKMILPVLGGTPAVWNACMVFFQAALLLGYIYAHGLPRNWSFKTQVGVHALILLIPLAFLPIAVVRGTQPPVSALENPTWWLLWRLFVTVAAPFVVASTSAPLLQRWFAETGHRDAADPYFLYAASNVGSLLALLGYPLFVERMFDIDQQGWIWAGGYVLLLVLIIICGLTAARYRAAAPESGMAPAAAEPEPVPIPEGPPTGVPPEVALAAGTGTAYGAATSSLESPTAVVTAAPATSGRRLVRASTRPPDAARRLHWLALSAIPSSLVLGVTTHLTTDIAAVPLLWVLPLSLYLLTFIIVFAKRPIVKHTWVRRALPFVALIIAPFIMTSDLLKITYLVAAELFLFFALALACHGELVRLRPPSKYLTEFYLYMALGGVLGGMFNALLAPNVFPWVLEYPLMIVLACAMVPPVYEPKRGLGHLALDVAVPAVLCALGIVAFQYLMRYRGGFGFGIAAPVYFACVVLGIWVRERPIRLALTVGAMLIIFGSRGWFDEKLLHRERNFFGVKRIRVDGDRVELLHGSTLHGSQFREQVPPEPLSYYHKNGPLGEIMREFDRPEYRGHVAAVGLGTGSISAYCRPGEKMTYYEIDPSVLRIAKDSGIFTYLKYAGGAVDFVMGDGRQTMQTAPDHEYGIIILDAFSSDAIPTHLMTIEAVKMYFHKARDGGLVVFHVSNRYLALEPILAAIADKLGVVAITTNDFERVDVREPGQLAARYVVLAKDMDVLQPLTNLKYWQQIKAVGGIPAWSDRYCDLISAVEWARWR